MYKIKLNDFAFSSSEAFQRSEEKSAIRPRKPILFSFDFQNRL